MKQFLISKSVWLVSAVFLLLFQLLLYQFAESFPSLTKATLQVSFIVIVALSFWVYGKITKSFFSIYSLFLILFVYFLGSRVILDFFGYMDISQLDMYKKYILSNVTVCRVILNFNIALLSFFIGVVFFSYRNPFFSYKIALLDSDFTNNKIIDALFFVGILFKIYFAYVTFTQLQEKGYLAYFLGEFEIDKNIVEWFLESFALVALFVYYTGKREISKWIWGGTILYAILALATGQRGFGFLFLVFTFLFLVQVDKVRMTKKKMLILFVILYSISTFIELLRVNMTNEEGGISFLFKGILNFFWNGGVSFSLLAYSIDYKNVLDYSFFDLFGNVASLFEYYINKFQGIPQPTNVMLENAQHYKIFGPYLSYVVNPKYYSLGFALGSSYVAQLYTLGGETMQIFGGVFVGYSISLFYLWMKSDKFFIRFVGFNFLISYIYIPRDNLFDFVTENWYAYVSCLVYVFLIKYLISKGLYNERINA